MDVHKMLEQVKAGQLDIAEAETKLKDLPYEEDVYKRQIHTFLFCLLRRYRMKY